MTRERTQDQTPSVLTEVRQQQQRPDRMDLLTSFDPEIVAWRRQQADVDADIEGLARDEDADRLADELQAQGLDVEERIARLKQYFIDKTRGPSDEG